MKFKINEKFDSRIAKALGEKIFKTSNVTGLGNKYKQEVVFVKKHYDLFGLPNNNIHLAAHHSDHHHGNDAESNVYFYVFEDHSTYHSLYISAVEEVLSKNYADMFDYDSLDCIARIIQINTFIDKCNSMYSDIIKLDRIELNTKLLDEFVLFVNSNEISQAVTAIINSKVTIEPIPLEQVRKVMKQYKEENTN